MNFWDDLQSKAKEAAKIAGQTFDDVKEQGTTQIAVLKIKRQISLCESEIEGLQKAIGKRVYDLQLIQPEGFADPEIQKLCGEITEQLNQIAGLEKEIVELQDESDQRAAKAEEEQKAAEAGEAAAAEPPKEDPPA